MQRNSMLQQEENSPLWHVIVAASLRLPPSPLFFFCFSAQDRDSGGARPGSGRPGSLFRAGSKHLVTGAPRIVAGPLLHLQAHLTSTTLTFCRETSAAPSCPACSSSSPLSHTDYSFTSIRSPRLPRSLFLAFSAFLPLWTRGRRPSRLSTNRGPLDRASSSTPLLCAHNGRRTPILPWSPRSTHCCPH